MLRRSEYYQKSTTVLGIVRVYSQEYIIVRTRMPEPENVWFLEFHTVFVRVEEGQEAELDASGECVATCTPERAQRVERADQHEAVAGGREAHELPVSVPGREVHKALVRRPLAHSEIGVLSSCREQSPYLVKYPIQTLTTRWAVSESQLLH